MKQYGVGKYENQKSYYIWAGGLGLGSWVLKKGKKRASTRTGEREEKALMSWAICCWQWVFLATPNLCGISRSPRESDLLWLGGICTPLSAVQEAWSCLWSRTESWGCMCCCPPLSTAVRSVLLPLQQHLAIWWPPRAAPPRSGLLRTLLNGDSWMTATCPKEVKVIIQVPLSEEKQ